MNYDVGIDSAFIVIEDHVEHTSVNKLKKIVNVEMFERSRIRCIRTAIILMSFFAMTMIQI